MREKIQKLANGIFEYDSPKLGLSTTSISEVVEECARFSGSFSVENLGGGQLEGIVIPNHVRMWCKEPRFSGQNCEIKYEVDLRGLSFGEEVKGTFTILSSGGESTVACSISIEKCLLEKEGVQIKNLFHFANYAREDWEGAVKRFKSPDFRYLLVGNDRQYRELYQALSCAADASQAMDEFLVSVHKKERVHMNLPEKKMVLKHISAMEKITVTLEKSTWGYAFAKVSARGDFLKLEKTTIGPEDFLGNSCEIPCYVNPEKMHEGVNSAEIIIETAFETLVFEVEAHKSHPLPIWEIEEQLLRGKMALYQAYLEFRKKKLTPVLFAEKAAKILDELEAIDSENAFFQLLRVQLAIIGRKEQDAVWYLEPFEDGKELKAKNKELYGYFLYLRACLKKDEKITKSAVEEIRLLYSKNRDSFLLLWTRLYMDDELKNKALEKWELLQEQFELGCHSPMLYQEAYDLILAEETLLKTLDAFTVQVLCFAIKEDLFKPNLAQRILSLSVRGISVSPALFKLYTKLYELAPNKERLAAVVGLLIRGQKIGGIYTSWYELAVKQNLKIAGLFENYMESVGWNKNQELPANILLYFAMDSTLGEGKKAWIYQRIVSQKETFPAVYKQTRREIEVFTKEHMVKGEKDANLAILYADYLVCQLRLEAQQRDEDFADMEEILFWNQIICRQKNITKILVAHRYLTKVEEYPCKDQVACIPVYSEDDCIVLLDINGRCYAREEDYEIKHLFENGAHFEQFEERSLGMQLRLELAGERYRTIDNFNKDAVLSLVDEERLQKEIKNDLLEKLMIYYHNNGLHSELEKLLMRLRMEDFSDIARNRVLEFMLAEGIYDKAWSILQEYGYSDIYPGQLVGILGWRIRENAFEWEASLLKICNQVFTAGKYNEDMLLYLMRHTRTDSKTMQKIWQAAGGFGEDNTVFGQQLLTQILLTGRELTDVEDVVGKLAENGGDSNVIRAYLARAAYSSIVEEKVISSSVLKRIEELLVRDKEAPAICMAAWLKGVAEGRCTALRRDLVLDCIKKCRKTGYVFPCYKNLEKATGLNLGMEQLEFICFKTASKKPVALHYMLIPEDKEEAEFDTKNKQPENEYFLEKLTPVLPGVYTKELTVFYGEKLVYHIMEGDADRANLVLSEEISGERPVSAHGSRKNLLARIAYLENNMDAQDDEKELFSLLDEYVSLDFMTEALFQKK